MSSNSSERTRFTITTNGTPFGQYRGIVFLSQLGPSTRKAWMNQSLNDSTDELIIGSINGPSFQRNDSINMDNVTYSPTTGVIIIQNNVVVNSNDEEPDYNFGHYN